MTLNSPWFELVESGKKVFEGRRVTRTTRQIKVGDFIDFSHHIHKTMPTFSVQVIDIHHFQTFEQALLDLGIDRVLPIPGLTLKEAVQIYRQFVSLETQIKSGVVMFNVKQLTGTQDTRHRNREI